MVFQNYALYPHMSVYDNMAFALKLRRIPGEEIEKRVRQAAQMLAITDYLSASRASFRWPAAAGRAGPRAGA